MQSFVFVLQTTADLAFPLQFWGPKAVSYRWSRRPMIFWEPNWFPFTWHEDNKASDCLPLNQQTGEATVRQSLSDSWTKRDSKCGDRSRRWISHLHLDHRFSEWGEWGWIFHNQTLQALRCFLPSTKVSDFLWLFCSCSEDTKNSHFRILYFLISSKGLNLFLTFWSRAHGQSLQKLSKLTKALLWGLPQWGLARQSCSNSSSRGNRPHKPS